MYRTARTTDNSLGFVLKFPIYCVVFFFLLLFRSNVFSGFVVVLILVSHHFDSVTLSIVAVYMCAETLLRAEYLASKWEVRLTIYEYMT